MNARILSVVGLGVALVACGGNDKSPGTVNPGSARTSIDQVGNVNVAMSASNGASAASAVAAMTAAGQGIVTPATGREVIGLLPAELPRPAVQLATTGTANCTPTMCTFTNFGDDTPGNSWKIDGTIHKTGDTITFDLSYDIVSSGLTVAWAIDGSVTVTATNIDGHVHSHGVSSGAQSVTWDVAVDYLNVGLDGTGCPTSGSVHASTSYEVAGQLAYDVEGTVAFGPACGQTH